MLQLVKMLMVQNLLDCKSIQPLTLFHCGFTKILMILEFLWFIVVHQKQSLLETCQKLLHVRLNCHFSRVD